MSKVIAVFNQKGGVGKTTTNVNLTASLGTMGKKILVLDLDPQGNTTSGYGIEKHAVERTIYDVIIDGVDISETILKTETKKWRKRMKKTIYGIKMGVCAALLMTVVLLVYTLAFNVATETRIKQGEQGDRVVLVQEKLKELGIYDGERNGIYDMFDNIWSCDDFNLKKSDVKIYQQAAFVWEKKQTSVISQMTI